MPSKILCRLWIAWKLFGAMPLTIIFSLLQVPLIRRHMPAEAETTPDSAG